MQLIILTGLPGTGKSSIAEAVGKVLSAPVFAKDWLQATLVRAGLNDNPACAERLGYASYDLLTALAERQLQLGQTAVLDSVATFTRIRQQWQTLANQCNAQFSVIECICSDETIHRRRLESRQRSIPGWPELSWEQVTAVQKRYDPWTQPRLTLDAINPLQQNILAAISYLTQPPES